MQFISVSLALLQLVAALPDYDQPHQPSGYQSPNEGHRKNQLKVVLTVDNIWNMTIFDGKQYHHEVGPRDNDGSTNSLGAKNGYAWADVKSFTYDLHGRGPYMVAVDGQDYGVIAGFFGQVYVNDKLFTETGVANTKFVAYDSKYNSPVPADWDNVHFKPDSKWVTPHACNIATTPDLSAWNGGNLQAQFQKLVNNPSTTVNPSWLPACDTPESLNKHVYFRLDIPKRHKRYNKHHYDRKKHGDDDDDVVLKCREH
ncbi:hypothetical protein HK103_003503 [Boothiomyces macroporosus]|uniref:Uncharacterized protein n=1 Tax=Boothiomyces macroporosus TaxID=261099 RepID=A0AAD5UHR8_9FUNG|nr:hypothetical protein HK103_003503 [Boothiomyces macroporosus]KAJ3314082.1 hypothetical protein HDV04_001113 [Boothiomyces sp. JEL0838]